MDSVLPWHQYYYVEYWSLRIAGWFLLVGMIGVLPDGRVLFQRQARLRWLWIPTLASLFLFLYPSMFRTRSPHRSPTIPRVTKSTVSSLSLLAS